MHERMPVHELKHTQAEDATSDDKPEGERRRAHEHDRMQDGAVQNGGSAVNGDGQGKGLHSSRLHHASPSPRRQEVLHPQRRHHACPSQLFHQ